VASLQDDIISELLRGVVSLQDDNISELLRGVASLQGDNLEVDYYLRASEI